MLELRDILLVTFITGWITILLRSYLGRFKGRIRLPYPPGPTRKFLVGNLFDMPKERPYLQYAKWATEYNSTLSRSVGRSFIMSHGSHSRRRYIVARPWYAHRCRQLC